MVTFAILGVMGYIFYALVIERFVEKHYYNKHIKRINKESDKIMKGIEKNV